MGIFGGLFGGGGPEAKIKKHAPRVANKRLQAPDRWASIEALGELEEEEAIAALLQRFNYRCDPSITDGEEKERVFQLIKSKPACALKPTLAYLQTSDSLSWPVKILGAIADDKTVIDGLLEVLSKLDDGYERDPQRKIQALTMLGDYQDPRIKNEASRFVDDMNETVRFHAATTIFAQSDSGEDESAALRAQHEKDESVRVKNCIKEGFAAKGWNLEA